MSHKVKLTSNLIAQVFHSRPTQEGAEAWRVIVGFVDESLKTDGLVKRYYVWVTGEYLEDEVRMSAGMKSATRFALQVVQWRFEESGNKVPVENGISFSNAGGEEFVDPKDYTHPSKHNHGQ